MSVGGGIPGSSGPRRFLRRREQQRVTHTTTVSTAAPTVTTPAATTQAPTTLPTVPLSAFAAAISGLSCSGTWTNVTFNSSGPSFIKASGTGNAGTITLTIGGNAFGAAGGTVNLPFTVKDGQFVVDTDAGFLGHVQATVDGTGKISGGMTAPPSLGPKEKVAITSFGFANKGLTAAVDIDFGTGAPHATSKLDATCH